MNPLTLLSLILTLAFTSTLAAPTSRNCPVDHGYSPPRADVESALSKFLTTCSSNPPRIPEGSGCTKDFATFGKAAIRVCPGLKGIGKGGIVLSCEDIKNGVQSILKKCEGSAEVSGEAHFGGDVERGYVVVARDVMYKGNRF